MPPRTAGPAGPIPDDPARPRCVGPYRGADAGGQRARARPGRSASGARRGACSTAPTSTWRPARSSPCSAAPARASRRCCTCSAGSTGPDGGRRRGRRRARDRRLRAAAVRAAAAPRRVRVPVLPPAARADRRGERAARRRGCAAPSPGAAARGRALVDAARARRRRGLVPAPALRRRAAALRDRPRARQRPGACVLADEPTGNLDVEAGADGARAAARSSPTRAARSCSSRTRPRRRRSPTGCCGCATAGWSRREPRAARARPARRGRCSRRSACSPPAIVVGTAATRRLRARHRLRPRRGRRRPARRDRALRRASRASTVDRARARAAERRGALVPLRDPQRRRCAADGHATGKGAARARARRAPRLRDHRRAATCAGRGEVVIERGLAREWGLAPGDRMRRRRRFGRCASSASRVAPDNVAFPLDRHAARLRVSTRGGRPGVAPGQRRAALARRPGTRRRHARAGARDVVRDRRARVRRRAPASRCCSTRPPGIVIALLVAFSLVALDRGGDDARGRRAGRRPAAAAGARGAARARASRPGGSPRAHGGRGGARRRCRRRCSGWRSARSPWPARRPTCSPSSTSSRPAPRCSRSLAALPARRSSALVDRRGDLARLARGAPAAGRDPARRRPRPRARAPRARAARRAARAPARASPSPRAARCARVGGDDRGLRGRRPADARARLAARAAARRPGDARQALPADRRGSNPFEVDAVERSPAWPTPAERYQADVADAFRLGEPLRLVAYPGDHTASRRRRSRRAGGCAATARRRSASGWPTRSGCGPARRSPSRRQGGDEARFRVVGRRARARARRPDRLRAAARGCSPPSPAPARRSRCGSRPGADRAAVERGLAALGAPPQPATGADDPQRARSSACSRRCCAAVGLAVGLVCLYALVQALAMTARERRGAVALLRACGADARDGRGWCSPARRSRSRSRPRSPACCSSGWCSARSSRGSPRATPTLPLAPAAGPGRCSSPAACCCSPRPRPRSSRAARCASRSSRGCGRSDARAPRAALARGARARRSPAAAATTTAAAAPAARPCDATLVDRDGDGALERGPGEPLRRPHRARARRAAGRGARHARPAHRPARARRGVAGARAVPRPPRRRRSTRRSGRRRRSARRCSPPRCAPSTALAPEAVFVTGDLIDSAQRDELDQALAVLDGGARRPGHRRARLRRRAGGRRPRPVLLPARPRRAAPPGPARRAPQRPFRSPGLRAPWYPAARQPRPAACRARRRRPPAHRRGRRPARGWSTALDPRRRAPPRRGRRPPRSTRCSAPARPAAAIASRPTRRAAFCARRGDRRPGCAPRRRPLRAAAGGRRSTTPFDLGAARARARARHRRPRRRLARAARRRRSSPGCARSSPRAGDRARARLHPQPARQHGRRRRRSPRSTRRPRRRRRDRRQHAPQPDPPRAARRLLADRHVLARRLPAAGARAPPAPRPRAAASCSRPGWSTTTAAGWPASRASSRSSTRRAAGRRATPARAADRNAPAVRRAESMPPPCAAPVPLAVFCLVAGTLHFLRPRIYEAIVPDALPAKRERRLRERRRRARRRRRRAASRARAGRRLVADRDAASRSSPRTSTWRCTAERYAGESRARAAAGSACPLQAPLDARGPGGWRSQRPASGAAAGGQRVAAPAPPRRARGSRATRSASSTSTAPRTAKPAPTRNAIWKPWVSASGSAAGSPPASASGCRSASSRSRRGSPGRARRRPAATC